MTRHTDIGSTVFDKLIFASTSVLIEFEFTYLKLQYDILCSVVPVDLIPYLPSFYRDLPPPRQFVRQFLYLYHVVFSQIVA